MSHRKWRESKQQPSRARSGNKLSCCFVSLLFLCDILSGRPVRDRQGRRDSREGGREEAGGLSRRCYKGEALLGRLGIFFPWLSLLGRPVYTPAHPVNPDHETNVFSSLLGPKHWIFWLHFGQRPSHERAPFAFSFKTTSLFCRALRWRGGLPCL